jgi:hypothetical protein
MIVANRPYQAKVTARSPARDEMGWLMAVAAAFLLTHVVALTICGRASANEPAAPEQAAISSLRD